MRESRKKNKASTFSSAVHLDTHSFADKFVQIQYSFFRARRCWRSSSHETDCRKDRKETKRNKTEERGSCFRSRLNSLRNRRRRMLKCKPFTVCLSLWLFSFSSSVHPFYFRSISLSFPFILLPFSPIAQSFFSSLLFRSFCFTLRLFLFLWCCFALLFSLLCCLFSGRVRDAAWSIWSSAVIRTSRPDARSQGVSDHCFCVIFARCWTSLEDESEREAETKNDPVQEELPFVCFLFISVSGFLQHIILPTTAFPFLFWFLPVFHLPPLLFLFAFSAMVGSLWFE